METLPVHRRTLPVHSLTLPVHVTGPPPYGRFDFTGPPPYGGFDVTGPHPYGVTGPPPYGRFDVTGPPPCGGFDVTGPPPCGVDLTLPVGNHLPNRICTRDVTGPCVFLHIGFATAPAARLASQFWLGVAWASWAALRQRGQACVVYTSMHYSSWPHSGLFTLDSRL